jgi:hypothetical protein
MSKFLYGHAYPAGVSYALPANLSLPYVTVYVLAEDGTGYRPVIGKMDTGANFTILTFTTAQRLGIKDPAAGCAAIIPGVTATGETISVYRRFIIINIQGADVLHVRQVGFAKELKRDLFGLDWTDVFCLVFDSSALHFLKS